MLFRSKGEDQWHNWNVNTVRRYRGEGGADSAFRNQGSDSGPWNKGSVKGQWGAVAGPGGFSDSPVNPRSKGGADSAFRSWGPDSGPWEKGSAKGKRPHEGSGWNSRSQGVKSEADSWSQGAEAALEEGRWRPHCKGYEHTLESCWSLQF